MTVEQRHKRAQAALRRLVNPPARRRPYYAARRVPHTFSPAYLRTRLLPLVPLGLAAVGATVAATLPIGPQRRLLAEQASEEFSASLSERSQRLYFDNPGLDTLTVRAISTHAQRLTHLARLYLRTRVALGWDTDGRAATTLPLIPTRKYDALMVGMLVVGTALGYFVGGPIHARLVYDSATPHDAQDDTPQPATAQPRRLDPPRRLSDMAADVDDLYWANGAGQCIKITAVGEAPNRRWLVSLPGTAHTGPASSANPADLEANIREALNLPSGMRIGVIRAVHRAMNRAGVKHHTSEPILMVGHSQGGMVATALASMPTRDSGLAVRGVIAYGSPTRRMRIRPDVTMLSVAHDQDIVPSVDGSAERTIDHRITIRRHLNRPRSGPLYYAHASMTYTETLRHVERRADITPFGRVAAAVDTLRSYLPVEGEPTRTFVYDISQELLEPTSERTWDTVATLGDWSWEPVIHDNDWAPTPLIPYNSIHVAVHDLRKWWSNGAPA